MEQFSLEKWLQDKSRKICTRDGRPVRIVCWDRNTTYWKIVGLVTSPDGSTENLFTYDVNGKESDSCLHDKRNDLFFAHEEEDEFETTMISFSHAMFDHLLNSTNVKVDVKEWKNKLLDLARKEIKKENSEFKPKFTYNEKDYSELANKLIEFRNNTPLCSVSYRDGEGRRIILHYEKEILDLVKKEILKDLPKWKKANEYKDLKKHIVIFEEDRVFLSDYLEEGDYYIDLEDLKTLPKEE